MSDQPPGSTPPPPPSMPPPPAPGPASQFPPSYVQGTPGQMPPPIKPAAGMGGAAGIISQFTGAAGWGTLLGVVGIVVPFVFNRIFFFLPIIGLLAGIQAIRTGKLIGGIVAIVLNVIAGIITLIGLFAG